MNHLYDILHFMLDALLRVWPYLLLTIPAAVAVNLGGASRYINRAFSARPLAAILLATAVGAFSPFCSCSVIPVVAALLIGGVPLAPVMAFWIASPSMDPETFFLSVALVGWPLALWRLGATLALSLGAGYLTHLLVRRGWLGRELLRARAGGRAGEGGAPIGDQELAGRHSGAHMPVRAFATAEAVPLAAVAGGLEAVNGPKVRSLSERVQLPQVDRAAVADCAGNGGSCAAGAAAVGAKEGRGFGGLQVGDWRHPLPERWRRLVEESWKATVMVAKFMLLAFFLEALITLYVPEVWIVGLLGRQNALAIPIAALLGVPVYTSNLAALPLVGGLLAQGMDPAAALAFLVAGPTTTLPAMSAVWGLVRVRVFALYVGLALVGAVLAGLTYQLVM